LATVRTHRRSKALKVTALSETRRRSHLGNEVRLEARGFEAPARSADSGLDHRCGSRRPGDVTRLGISTGTLYCGRFGGHVGCRHRNCGLRSVEAGRTAASFGWLAASKLQHHSLESGMAKRAASGMRCRSCRVGIRLHATLVRQVLGGSPQGEQKRT
jgi:hypothetical protein